MTAIEIICGIIVLIAAVCITLLVLVQSSPKQGGGLGAISGGESFYSQNKSRTKDAVLVKFTKFAATAFFIITMLVYTVLSYGWFQ